MTVSTYLSVPAQLPPPLELQKPTTKWDFQARPVLHRRSLGCFPAPLVQPVHLTSHLTQLVGQPSVDGCSKTVAPLENMVTIGQVSYGILDVSFHSIKSVFLGGRHSEAKYQWSKHQFHPKCIQPTFSFACSATLGRTRGGVELVALITLLSTCAEITSNAFNLDGWVGSKFDVSWSKATNIP